MSNSDPNPTTKPTPGRILVMDDDELILQTAQLMLKRLGYDVELATHGQQAIEIYTRLMSKDDPVALAILDLRVADGMGAVETAAQILARDPEAKLVIASGSVSEPEMQNPPDYGFVDRMTKPFLASDLGLVIGGLLD